MKGLQELTKEINDLTLKIKQDYPELYQYLDENPITIPYCDHPKMDTKSFSGYLDSLTQLFQRHVESRPNKQNS